MKIAVLCLVLVLLVSCKQGFGSDEKAETTDTTPPLAIYPDAPAISDATEAAMPEEADPDYGKNQVLLNTPIEAKYEIGNGYDMRKAKMIVDSYASEGGVRKPKEITLDEALKRRGSGESYWGDFLFDYCIVTKSNGDTIFGNIEEYKNTMPLKDVLYNGYVLKTGDKVSDRFTVKNIEVVLQGGTRENSTPQERYRIELTGDAIFSGYAVLEPPAGTAPAVIGNEDLCFTPTAESYGELPVIQPVFNNTIFLDSGQIVNTDVPMFNLGGYQNYKDGYNDGNGNHLNKIAAELDKDKGAVKVTYHLKDPVIEYGTGYYPCSAIFEGEVIE